MLSGIFYWMGSKSSENLKAAKGKEGGENFDFSICRGDWITKLVQ